jgi:Prp8 binding protein
MTSLPDGMAASSDVVVVPALAIDENIADGEGLPRDTILRLEGHNCAVTSLCFHPHESFLASGGFDGRALLWQTNKTPSSGILSYTGHKASVTAVAFVGTEGDSLATASADKTVAVSDFATAARLKTLRGHKSHVTCVDGGASLAGAEFRHESKSAGKFCLVSGSNDRTARLWDIRSHRRREEVLFAHGYQVLDVKFGEDMQSVFTSGIDPRIHAWDVRKPSEVMFTLEGHTDMVTGLAISPLGSHLASHGADGTVGIWDVRPFVGQDGSGDRLELRLGGCVHGFEHNLMRLGWDRCGTRVVAGSADGTVAVWDADDGELVFQLGGHHGCVNDVRFSPTDDTLIASASSDQVILLGHIPTAP